MLKHNFWQRITIEIVLVLVASTIIGLYFHQLLIGIIIGLLLIIAWLTYNLGKLSRWIWQRNNFYPPTSLGALNILFYGLHKRQLRKRNKQNELAEIIKRFRHGAQSLPDALLMTNKAGQIEWINKSAQYQLNVRWPDDQGQNIINLIRQPEFARYMQKKDFTQPLTLFFQQQRYIEFRIIPYDIEHWIIIARDVDQVYLAEKQRQDFFSNASHELRTPLTVLNGYLDMLSDNLISADKQQQIFSVMHAQTERMTDLVKQILTLNQIENTPITNKLESVNIPEMLAKIEHNVKQLYPKHHFIFDVDKELIILGHKEQLYSVVTNLIYNSAKHTPLGTNIKVNWRNLNNQAYFSITDDGQGIAPEHLHRLTERFYQVDSARNNQNEGSGLGLAIVKHALLNHGKTKLEIKSELGKGSEFSFTLPTQFNNSFFLSN